MCPCADEAAPDVEAGDSVSRPPQRATDRAARVTRFKMCADVDACGEQLRPSPAVVSIPPMSACCEYLLRGVIQADRGHVRLRSRLRGLRLDPVDASLDVDLEDPFICFVRSQGPSTGVGRRRPAPTAAACR